MDIGERIRHRREELNLTQEEVAKRLGYANRSSVNKFENSRTLPLAKVKKIADILDCSPNYIMGWEEETTYDSTNNELNNYISKLAKLSINEQKEVFGLIDKLNGSHKLKGEVHRRI